MPPKKRGRWFPRQKKVNQEKKQADLRVQFPVSSGSQHRKIEDTPDTSTTQTQTWPLKEQVLSKLSRPWKGNKSLSTRSTLTWGKKSPLLNRTALTGEQNKHLFGRLQNDAPSSRVTQSWEEKTSLLSRTQSWGHNNNAPTSRLSQSWEENSSLSSRPTQDWGQNSYPSSRPTQNWEDNGQLSSRSSQNWEDNGSLSSRSTLAWGSHPPSGRGTYAWEQLSSATSEPSLTWEQNYAPPSRQTQTQTWEHNRLLISRPPPNWEENSLLASQPVQSWVENDSLTDQPTETWEENSFLTNRPMPTWGQDSLSTNQSMHAWEQESLTRQLMPPWEERNLLTTRQTWTQNNQADHITSTTRMDRSSDSLNYQDWRYKDSLERYGPPSADFGPSKHFGMRMLQKMGWIPGEGLGKNKEGMIEPLMPDANVDPEGVYCPGGWTPQQGKPVQRKPRKLTAKDLSGKHPVSGLIELCTNRNWTAPVFQVVSDVGPVHKKTFIMKVIVNGREYTSKEEAPSKKLARSKAAIICLQSLGLLPKKKS